MKIRPAGEDDLAKLTQLSQMNKSWLSAHLNPLFLILEEDNEIIAGIIAFKRDEFPNGFEKFSKKSILIEDLFVNPNFANRGYDKVILSTFLDEVKGKVVYFCVRNGDETWLKLLDFFDFVKEEEFCEQSNEYYLWDE